MRTFRQGGFPLTPTAKDVFEFAEAGITLGFNLATSQMRLKQKGKDVMFTKEKN